MRHFSAPCSQQKTTQYKNRKLNRAEYGGMLRTATEKGLIQNIDTWFEYRQMRNITSHTYDHEKAQQIYEMIRGFLKDASTLFHKLEQRDD